MKSTLITGVAFLIFMLSGGLAIMWLGAEPRDVVSQLYPEADLPDSWKAVLVNHGHFMEWKLGLVRDNILGFGATCACALIALICFVKMLNSTKRPPATKV
jgi:hypothetical protein